MANITKKKVSKVFKTFQELKEYNLWEKENMILQERFEKFLIMLAENRKLSPKVDDSEITKSGKKRIIIYTPAWMSER